MHILHERIGTSKTPTGTGVPSNRKENVEPYNDNQESSEPMTEIEVTTDGSKEVNWEP